jgi:hypothetical protein
LTEFLNAILAFPTVLLTIPLGVMVAYWLFVILGALDINLLGDADLDGHGHTDLHLDGHGHVDGHLDAQGHADGHGHDGHVLGDADLDAAGHTDLPADGHLDGHLDGHGHGGHDGHDGHDHHADEHTGGAAGLIHALGLGGVPVTVMLSILIATAWVFCIGGTELLDLVGAGSPADVLDWKGVLVGLASLGLAVPVTRLLIRPLRRFFRTLAAPQHRDLLGKICTITTLHVNERYGQAEVEDGGAGLIVQVRSHDPGRLSRGDRAVIFDYRDEVFHVAPMDETLRQNLDQLGSRERG